MAPAALALDIDGTIDTADKQQLSRLNNAARRLGVPRYINTARSNAYCHAPDRLTTKLCPRSKHHCLVSNDVPYSKLVNMRKIQKHARVRDPACVMLIDDRPENIQKINSNGYTGIRVQDTTGIRRETVDEAIETMRLCASNPKGRGVPDNVDVRLRARLFIIVLIAILLIAYLMLL